MVIVEIGDKYNTTDFRYFAANYKTALKQYDCKKTITLSHFELTKHNLGRASYGAILWLPC